MSLDIIDAVLEVAEPLAQVSLQQVLDDVFDVRPEMRRKPNLRTRAPSVTLINAPYLLTQF